MSNKHGEAPNNVTVTNTKTATTKKTKTEFDHLTPMEEKVARMRMGISIEETGTLTMVDEIAGIPPESVAQIRAIERHALETQGQLVPLSTKERIISSLKNKSHGK